MSEDVRVYLIAETSLRIVIDITFMVLYFLRIYKLDRMASNNFHSKPRLMKFTVILLVTLQIMFAIHITLAYVYQSYWMNPYKNFVLVSIPQIVNCLLQIYIIRKQHKKKAMKATSVPFLWILWLSFDIAQIVFVQIKISSITIILIVFQAMVFVALIVIRCLIQQKKLPNVDLINTVNSPLITQTRKIHSEYGSQLHDSGKLYVEFNKQFNISMKNNHAFYQFKFAVIIGENSHILTRKQEDFMSLVVQMLRTFPQCQELRLQEKKNQSFSNMIRYGQEKQKVYQTYLVKLTQNQNYYTTYLLDFLQICPLHRIKLTKKREKLSFYKKDSFRNQDEQRHKKPFFQVQLVNNKIQVSNPQILEIFLNKSKTQIQKFHNKLISQKKLKMQLINQDPDMNQLIHFIFRVVNSKYLWKSFSQWLVLGKQLEQKIYNMFDFWNYGFKSIKIGVIGYQIAFDRQGSLHSLYLISLSQKEYSQDNVQQSPGLILKQDVTLKKRFNDFVKLDKNVKKFMSLNNLKSTSIIALPPKFSPFGTKTSPKSRQIYLDMYLNEVIKIEKINHCVQFLQFLEVDLGRFKEDFHTVDQDNLVSQHISSMIIDDLCQKN